MNPSLQDKVSELAAELGVPGVAVAIVHDGKEEYAFAGVTSTENPLTVDENTLFQFGSTGKTFTATAVMRLVEQGKIDLDAPVRTYVPEFAMRDENAAQNVTVLQLFNHTAGWDGDLIEEMGNGDDVLATYVKRMGDLQQVTPLGAAVSYNNASLSLAGRVIEKVTGLTYETAMAELVFEPLGLAETYFFANDVMTRRFAVGHHRDPDGNVSVARPWALPRGNHPAGGMSATARDQIKWAKFHLGDGTAPDGSTYLSASNLKRMQEPTVEMPGSAIGDAVGISWLLSEVAGVRKVSHGGTTNGQYSDFVLVPDRNFAVTSLSNCGPNGSAFNHAIVQWAIAEYLGLSEPELVGERVADDELRNFAGRFETIATVVDVEIIDGRLKVQPAVKPEMAAALVEAGEEMPTSPPVFIAMLPGRPDQFVIDEGDGKGMRGVFWRGPAGTVDGVHFGGRLMIRTDTSAA